MQQNQNDCTLEFFEADYEHIRTEDLSPEILQVLEKINRKVADHESLDSLMNFVFEATLPICDCDRIWLAFVGECGLRVEIKWVRATYEPLLLNKGFTADIRKSYLRRVVQDKQVCVIHDLEAYSRENPDIYSARQLVREGVRSSMTAPLLLGDKTVALLLRSSRNPRAFKERNVRQSMATVERISQAVNMAYKMDELGQAVHSYMEMLGFISHELKSPLSTIIMDGRLVAEGYLGVIAPPAQEKIENIVDRAEYLLGLVREYLDLARIEGGQLQMNPRRVVNFAEEVVEPALELLKNQIAARNMNLRWHSTQVPLLVELDRELMRIVMINLISNAVKYGRDRGEIRVDAELTGDNLSVTVWNEGHGFTEEQLPQLFKKFTRLEHQDAEKTRGTGVGLFTCWRIVRLHGGTIEGQSEAGSWASFTFVIPQPLTAPYPEQSRTGQ